MMDEVEATEGYSLKLRLRPSEVLAVTQALVRQVVDLRTQIVAAESLLLRRELTQRAQTFEGFLERLSEQAAASWR